jgi:hypothetical protein
MVRDALFALLALFAVIGFIRAGAAGTQVLRHWSHFIDGWEHSSLAFYASLKEAIAARKVPKAKYSTVTISEGNAFSRKRIYLRARRSGQVMDICAAPFGRGFFVSWWLVVPPSWINYVPVIGWVIALFSPLTYYKLDTATMFQSVVHDAVQEVIDAATTAKGIRALTADERKPIMRDFFKR